jgi:hypothetical protein
MRAMWRGNRGPYGDASAIATHLEHLRSQQELTSDSILADAENRSSPLHSIFEWNDTKAARRFRRVQASTLVSRIVNSEGRRIYTRVAKSGETPAHFDLMTRVLRNPTLRRPIAHRALRELKNWDTKYADFPELQEAIQALQSALKRVVRPALQRMEEGASV